MRPVIAMRGVHRIFETEGGFSHVLHGVDFHVDPGEFVAITGPSGSGKSTLMNIIGCLDTATAGTYRLAGLNVADLTDAELAWVRASQIGFVFQSFNLLPRMTVLENVMLPLAYTGCPHAKRERLAVAALRSVALPVEHFDKRAGLLSGGQMQRVAIARALVNNPAIILADEPTGNLDSATGAAVLDTFHTLKERGKTIVLITHDPGVAATADRIVHIVDGRVDRDGSAIKPATHQVARAASPHASGGHTGASPSPACAWRMVDPARVPSVGLPTMMGGDS